MKRDWSKIKTMGEVMRAALECETKEEAAQFMEEYREITPHADENIGYMSGYYDNATMTKVQDLFDVAHPVFGRKVPSPEEAYQLGVNAGKARHD